MRCVGLAILMTCLLLIGHGAGAAMLGDATVPFSGDIVVDDSGKSYAGKVFGSPGRLRLEHTIDGGIPAIVILRADLNKGWLILPGFKTYSSFQFPPAVSALGNVASLGKPVSQEQVNGFLTNRYPVDRKIQDGSIVRGTLNLTPEGILMRARGFVERPGKTSEPVGIEVTHMTLAPQTPALFELPYGMSELPPQVLEGLLNMRMGKSRG